MVDGRWPTGWPGRMSHRPSTINHRPSTIDHVPSPVELPRIRPVCAGADRALRADALAAFGGDVLSGLPDAERSGRGEAGAACGSGGGSPAAPRVRPRPAGGRAVRPFSVAGAARRFRDLLL